MKDDRPNIDIELFSQEVDIFEGDNDYKAKGVDTGEGIGTNIRTELSEEDNLKKRYKVLRLAEMILNNKADRAIIPLPGQREVDDRNYLVIDKIRRNVTEEANNLYYNNKDTVEFEGVDYNNPEQEIKYEAEKYVEELLG